MKAYDEQATISSEMGQRDGSPGNILLHYSLRFKKYNSIGSLFLSTLFMTSNCYYVK